MAWLCAIALGSIGLLSRFVLAGLSIGSNDADGWRHHAEVVATHGVRFAYEIRPTPVWMFNHPPLMGYWGALARHMSGSDFHTFSLWMKAPGLAAEILSAILVYRILSKRRRNAGAWAFAAYGLSPTLILVSGYHCSTDLLYAALTLLAVYLVREKKSPFWAGLALALALNVKLMPIFLIPPLLAQCRSVRDLLRFSAGLALVILPYLPFLVTSARAMYENMVAYNSLQAEWGLLAFWHHARKLPALFEYAGKFGEIFIPHARYLILFLITSFSALAALRRRISAYELGALAWAVFLVFTPGFGVQYTACILPLLFVAASRRAIVYSITSGMMLLVIYTARMKFVFPLEALVADMPFPGLALLFGILAWATLVGFLVSTARKLLFLRLR